MLQGPETDPPFGSNASRSSQGNFSVGMHTTCFISTKYWNTWGLTFIPEQRLNCGQGAPLGSEILYQHLLCKCCSSLTCVSPYGCAGLGWWNHTARDSLTTTFCPPHLPLFLSGNAFPPGWTLKDLSSQFKSSANSSHAVPCPCTVQWYHSLLPWEAFVTKKGTHAMLLTENYNASSCKISEMVYSRSRTFLFLIWYFLFLHGLTPVRGVWLFKNRFVYNETPWLWL